MAFWLAGSTGVIDFFTVEASLTGWIAVFMTIFARRKAA